jgi:hypothetical protein
VRIGAWVKDAFSLSSASWDRALVFLEESIDGQALFAEP